MPATQRPLPLAVIAALLCSLPGLASAQELRVHPYLQLAHPDSVRVLWETVGEADAAVEWGPTDALGEVAFGDSAPGTDGGVHHDVALTGLDPATRYYYRVGSGEDASALLDFVTPALPSAEAPLRLVAMSDMQRDGAHPDVFRQVVEDGVLPFLAAEASDDLPGELDAVLIPGDLVTNGWNHEEWADTFFTPARALMGRVPTYPVLGNHEADTDFYFDYFALPDNGTAGYEEHWWFHDVGNLRIVGLDSNAGYTTQAQLEWLEETLAGACAEASIDFVLAQLHHPFKSELWLPGENLWTGQVLARLEEFSTTCGKPSVHLFGHTHGYSRGQSRDHQHLWVNVATAGGRIDGWGEYAQADYPEFVTSQSEYGFVVMETEAGDAPTLRLRRVSRGSPALPRDNEVRDEVRIAVGDPPPARPVALSPRDGERADPIAALLVASAFDDPDGDAHGSSHFQVSADCDAWEEPLWESWRQARNEYYGEDRQAGDDLADEVARELPPGEALCWRVRYRDAGLTWSEWSEPAAFTTALNQVTSDLLSDGGAEDELSGWDAAAGELRRVEAGDCAGVGPWAGSWVFALGGACEPTEYTEVSRELSLALWTSQVDDGDTEVRVRAMARSDGDGAPGVALVALGEDGAELASEVAVRGMDPSWTEIEVALPMPPGTRRVRVVLSSGDGPDAPAGVGWLDEVDVRLAMLEEAPAPAPEPEVEGCAGCTPAPGRGGVAGLALLVLAASARRRRTG